MPVKLGCEEVLSDKTGNHGVSSDCSYCGPIRSVRSLE